MKSALLFMYTESPLHAGTGSSVSAVDLPIQRERATQYPNVQGSGIKGALRSQCDEGETVSLVFGPETRNAADEAKNHAGAVSFGEARIALFPVRSLNGVFAYATSPLALSRLLRDADHAGLPNVPKQPPPPNTAEKALVTQNSALKMGTEVVLEEYTFNITEDKMLTEIGRWLAEHAFPVGDAYDFWRKKVETGLILLHEDSFRDFVVNSTEITTHVKLTETKTVQDGALWTQEALPSDTLLVSSLIARRVRAEGKSGSADEILGWLEGDSGLGARIQIGGDETTGQGIVSIRWQYSQT